MMIRSLWTLVFFNAAAEGAGGGAGGGEGGAPGAHGGEGGGAGDGPTNPFAGSGAEGGGAGGAPSDDGAGGPYHPEKLAEHLRGDNDRQTIDRLLAAYSGAREEMSKRGSVPESVDGYKFTLGEDLQKILGDPAQDASTKVFAAAAHKHGLTAEQAQGIYADFHAQILADGIVKPIDVEAEARKLAGDGAARMSPAEQLAAASKEWTDAKAWVDGLLAAKTLNEGTAGKLMELVETADGVLALKALKAMTREHGTQSGGGERKAITKADLDARQRDPRNRAMTPTFDPAFYAETQRLYQAFYGERPA